MRVRVRFKTAALTIGLFLGLATVAAANPNRRSAVLQVPDHRDHLRACRCSGGDSHQCVVPEAEPVPGAFDIGSRQPREPGSVVPIGIWVRRDNVSCCVDSSPIARMDRRGSHSDPTYTRSARKESLSDFTRRAVGTGIGVNGATNTIGLILLGLLR